MKIRILSDLHLEFCDLPLKEGDEDVVILAGDIEQGAAFEWARETFPSKYIIYVLGNHEFYNQGDFNAFIKDCVSRAEKNRIFLLHNECPFVSYKGWVFVGGTLWTDYRLFEPHLWQKEAMDIVKSALNDYRCIQKNGKNIQPEDLLAEHKTTLDKIKTYSTTSSSLETEKIFVVTHHTPSIKSSLKKYLKDPVTAGYASYLEDFIKAHPKIKYWVHGHTHNSSDYKIDQCRIVANPRGYARRINNGFITENNSFNPNLIIEI